MGKDSDTLAGILLGILGIATSVIAAQWEIAEVFPNQTNHVLELSTVQRNLLSLFS